MTETATPSRDTWMEAPPGTGIWEVIERHTGVRGTPYLLFFLVHLGLAYGGYLLQETGKQLPVIWPASGWLMTCLWLAGWRRWPGLALLQLTAESLAAHMYYTVEVSLLLSVADLLEGMLSAWLVNLVVREPDRVNVRQVARFSTVAAVGALAAAPPGAVASHYLVDPQQTYLQLAQLWWASAWLGAILVGPLAFFWINRQWQRVPELAVASGLELAVLLAIAVALSFYIFGTAPGAAQNLLQQPLTVLVFVVYCAFRLPPRWALVIAAIIVFAGAIATSLGRGPFVLREVFYRTATMQLLCIGVTLVSLLISVMVSAMRISIRRLQNSEFRYSSFVELSSEAVWCIEIEPPMPVDLPLADMQDWMAGNARLTECSRSYAAIEPEDHAVRGRPLGRDSVWSQAYRKYLEQLVQRQFAVHDLRASIQLQGREHEFLVSITGAVEDGRLRRIWGVARDVTELLRLNARLLREQQRLRDYARQILTADERARRATAVDLHDGIGQTLSSVGLRLKTIRSQAAPELRPPLEEMAARIQEVQDKTRTMIADLSPPGLYELGLVPALQWLVLNARSRDGLQVELETRVQEHAIAQDLRVLVFKLVRELLRNVVKHSGVRHARVQATGDQQELRIVVSDEGRGFEWEVDLSGAPTGGFGLWSMSDRVAEAGGELQVDTAPGSGARVTLKFALRR